MALTQERLAELRAKYGVTNQPTTPSGGSKGISPERMAQLRELAKKAGGKVPEPAKVAPPSYLQQPKPIAPQGTFRSVKQQKNIFTAPLQKGSVPLTEENGPKADSFGVKAIDFGVGVGKGALSTIRGASSLGERFLTGTLKTVLPKRAEVALGIDQPIERTTAERFIPKEYVTPIGTAQKVGFGAEQLGEFFLPASKVTKAGGALESIKALEGVGKTKSALRGVAKILPETIVGTGQMATQKGEIDKGVLGAGLVGGVFSGATNVAVKGLEKAPSKLWTGVLDRLSTSRAKNPLLEQQAAKTGIFGSRSTILSKAKDGIKKAELELDDILSGSTGKINGANVSKYLDDLEKSYSVIPGEQSSVDIIKSLKQEISDKGVMTAQEANNLKREIYKVTSNSYGKGMLEVPAKREAQKQIARGLKEEIEKIAPEVKDINTRQAVLLQMEKAVTRILNQRQKGIAGTGIGMYDLMLGGIGVSATGLPGIGLVVGKKILESAAFKSGLAKMINYFNDLSPTKKALFYNAIKGELMKKSDINKN